MQALAIWPSASESYLIPYSDSELSCYSCSVKNGERRKTLHASRLSYTSNYFRFFRSGGLGRINFLWKPKRSSIGADFTLRLSLEEEEPKLSNKVDTEDEDKEENIPDQNSSRVNVRQLVWELSLVETPADVEQILKERGNLPLQVYSTIIKSYGLKKKLEPAMAVYEWLKWKNKEGNDTLKPNVFIYNCLLEAMKQCKKSNSVAEVMNEMIKEGVNPSVVTYNTLMSIYIDQGRAVEALHLFNEMQKKNVVPSPPSYSTVLHAYRTLEDGVRAISFFVELRSKYQNGELEKDGENWDWDREFTKIEDFIVRICYQLMRHWLVKPGNRSIEVLRLLQEMDKARLKHGRSEYERLVWACTRAEHCVVAKELYIRIREIDSRISLSICNHIIWIMGKAKKWWAALEIYEQLLDHGPYPSDMSYDLIVHHFNILLSAARKRGIWRWGLRLLNKMEEKGLKPGMREWNSVLVACSKASETSAAVEIFKRMVKRGEKPTVLSYGALLSALEKGKCYDEAHMVWDHVIKLGIQPNIYLYTTMASIHVYQKQFDSLDNMINDMVNAGVWPTVVTFNAIISGCCRINLVGEAYKWFQRMELENICPDEITYEMLIEALANDGKPRLAYELYLRSRNNGLALSFNAYDAVIESAERWSASINVSALGPRPEEPPENKQENFTESRQLTVIPTVG